MATFTDPSSRIIDLINEVQPIFRRRFFQLVATLERQSPTVEQIALLLEQGRIGEALVFGETEALLLSEAWQDVFMLAGARTAAFVENSLQVSVRFNGLNERGFRAMQRNQLRLVTEFTREQTLATQEAILDGFRRGLNPREAARQIKNSIGLTQHQQRAVQNFERLLNERSPDSLNRKLRDRRFDVTVRRSIDTDTALRPDQVTRMVDRYRTRFIAHRAETISRTEALRAAHEGTDELYQQAMDSGQLEANELVRTWDTSKDGNVREPAHTSMEGQQRRVGEKFISGLGNELIRPGDPDAPPEETVRCRCAVTTRFSDSAVRQAEAQGNPFPAAAAA